jgi:hypothetical protein
MAKGFIFIGKQETGKSRTSKVIKKYYENKTILLDGRNFRGQKPSYFFRFCSPETKVIIIDEIIKLKYLEYFMEFIPKGKILVQPLNNKPYEIQIEKLIIICDSEINKTDLPQGASFLRRFEIIEFPNVNPELIINNIINESEMEISVKNNLLDNLSFLKK